MIKDLLLKGKILDILPLIKDYSLKSPIFVPSANLREHNIFNYYHDCVGFIYSDEKNLYSGYKNKFVYIDINDKIFNKNKSIQAKRLWIQNYCRLNNIKCAFVLDDDLMPFVRYNTKLIKLIDALKIIEIISFEMNLCLCTLNSHNLHNSYNLKQKIIFNDLYNTGGSMFINFYELENNNFHFENKPIHEDLAIWINCLRKNLNVLAINCLQFMYYYKMKNYMDLNQNTVNLYPELKIYFKNI